MTNRVLNEALMSFYRSHKSEYDEDEKNEFLDVSAMILKEAIKDIEKKYNGKNARKMKIIDL